MMDISTMGEEKSKNTTYFLIAVVSNFVGSVFEAGFLKVLKNYKKLSIYEVRYTRSGPLDGFLKESR